MDMVINIIGLVIGIVSLIVGILSLINTSLIKEAQIQEIQERRDKEIYESYAPRAAIVERPNGSGIGIVVLYMKDLGQWVDYLQMHPGERILTSQYRGNEQYNKVEVEFFE